MRIKSKNGLKVLSIAIALLLCLALAIGISGAFYQAQRQATGTLNMDQGIVIDYKGFGKTPNEGIWTRETTTTFLLFDETNAQPGAHIKVNAAGIRANEKSVNFYARLKLDYKFYNVVKSAIEGEPDTANLVYDSNATTGNVEGFKPSDLITTSANFFCTNWVESADGYYYYGSGTTLNTFTKASTTFVDLFATDAKFVIEGEGFKGSNDLEGGGFVVGETSINKIEVYLTLETLQGDATAEQAKALGWKISQKVDFSKVDEGKIFTSVNGDPVDEKLNVTINGNQTKLEEVKFPYGEETILEFDSKNVEYVELKYSDNTTEKFYELEASEISATKNSQIQVLADESHGTVKGYTVGLFGANEYKGFKFTTKGYNDDGTSYDIPNGIAVSGHLGSDAEITIPSSAKVRERDLKIVVKDIDMNTWAEKILPMQLLFASYPCTLTWYDGSNSTVIGNFANLNEGADFMESDWMYEHEFDDFSKYEFTFSYTALCETTNIFYSDKSVVEVAAGAFANSAYSKISLPNTIVKIGIFAFQYSAITSIVIPESVKSIGDYAFYGCSSLTSITIPEGVTSIGSEAFADCSQLKPSETDENNKIIYLGNESNPYLVAWKVTDTTQKQYEINNNCKLIYDRCFYDCSQATKIDIPNGVTSIGMEAFKGCIKLASIEIPNGVTSIKFEVFFGCKGLTSITIPDSVTSIEKNAFRNCSSLTSITIPDSVISIGDYAFFDCSGLTSITLGNSLESIGRDAFSNCSGLTSINIPDNVTSIGGSAFVNCSSLTSIVIPNSVTSIGDYAFHGCRGLTSVIIGSSVTSIGERAFSNCSGLTSVTIDSATIAGLGSSDSYLLYNATTVYVKSDITTVGSYITGSYTKAETSDKEGYVLYTKRA